MRRRFDTVRALCDATAETEKDRWPTQLRYFERAKAIILGDIQNYELTSLQPLWVQLGMAVTERADLVLSSPRDYQDYDCKDVDEAEAGAYERQVRNAIFEALEAFLREYPRDFALHLRKTRPHFQYRGLFDLSKEDVSDFWHQLPETLDGPVSAESQLEEQALIDWLSRLAKGLAAGLEPKEAFRQADASRPPALGSRETAPSAYWQSSARHSSIDTVFRLYQGFSHTKSRGEDRE
jgi:hypothetical protein